MNPRMLGMSAWALAAILTARADGPAGSPLPEPGFSGDRYAALWTKSPFAIATTDAAAASTDYSLVGLAQFDGVSYASLIDKQSQEHFVLASDKPVRNLTLLSISRQPDGSTAVIRRNGEVLSLKLDNASPPANGANPQNLQNLQASIPNAMSNNGMINQPIYRPAVRFHRPRIVVPPPPP